MSYKIGLDLGVASVGWCVLKTDENGVPYKIENLGSRVFDRAEHPKTGASLALERRTARGTRRRLRRRRHRRDRVLNLLECYNIITKKEVIDMYNSNYKFEKNVYQLRVEGLDTILTSKELARVLISFVKRRGYKSNSKSEESENKEAGKLLTATIENTNIMKNNNYRSVAEMYLKDKRYINTLSNGEKILKIRNTTDEYKSTVRREDLVNEIKLILNKQKELNPKITEEFIDKYLEIFESQRSFEEGPGGNSKYGGNQIEKMLGKCTFEDKEYRAMKATYSFEYFKLLQDINHIKIEYTRTIDGKRKNYSESLRKEQRDKIIGLAKKRDTISFLQIRKELNLDEDMMFNLVRYDYKLSKDANEVIKISEEKAKLKEFQSYHKIRKALDKVKKDKINEFSIKDLDNIGYALSVYKSDENKKEYLKNNIDNIDEEVIEVLLPLSFSKAGHLSLIAINKIIPYLEDGLTYDKATTEVYGEFRGKINTKRKYKLNFRNLEEEIPNPVVKRAVSQTIKVVNAIIDKYGTPQSVNIELARELAKTFSERQKIDKMNQERMADNEKFKKEIEELGKINVTGQDIVKYKLWKEQGEICVYTGQKIKANDLFTELVDVDHIVPYSLCFDDSYSNKVLVLSKANREKADRVPLQYFRETIGDKVADEYIVRVNNIYKSNNNRKKIKKLLLETISRDDIKGFKERSLKDTQYLSKVVHNLLRNNLIFEENENIKVKVEVVNGAITSHVRKRLGIEKIRSDGDEHHAIDAAIIASINPKLIQDITKFYQSIELLCYRTKKDFVDRETGKIIEFNTIFGKNENHFPEPYPGFRKELDIRAMKSEELIHEALKTLKYDKYENILDIKPIFVSRMPRRKVTGAAHKDTIRGLKKYENVYYSVTKTPLTKLKLTGDEKDIKGYPEKQKRDDIYLYKGLVERLKIFDGKAEEAFKEPFYKPNKDGTTGQLVKKVKIEEKISSFVTLNDGKSLAENGSMVRIDVFYVENKGYYFVPIYTADVLKDKLPNKASVAGKPVEEWKEMNEEDFIFSLYPNDLIAFEARKEINLKSKNDNKDSIKLKKMIGYYQASNISTASINVITHNNSYWTEGQGIKTLIYIKKYQVGILGDIHEVSLPEKRLGFNIKNRKGGKKA